MSWTGYVITDVDKPDVGLATAVWNEGQADEFRYSRRAKMTTAEGAVIREEAKAARDAAIAKRAIDTGSSNDFTYILNNDEVF